MCSVMCIVYINLIAYEHLKYATDTEALSVVPLLKIAALIFQDTTLGGSVQQHRKFDFLLSTLHLRRRRSTLSSESTLSAVIVPLFLLLWSFGSSLSVTASLVPLSSAILVVAMPSSGASFADINTSRYSHLPRGTSVHSMVQSIH